MDDETPPLHETEGVTLLPGFLAATLRRPPRQTEMTPTDRRLFLSPDRAEPARDLPLRHTQTESARRRRPRGANVEVWHCLE